MMFLWLIIIAAIIYYLYRGDRKIFDRKTPEQILDERLAKGEISLDEYQQIKNTMEDHK